MKEVGENKREVDFLIVGQGIAGSMLAWFLLQEGKTVVVINGGRTPNATSVSGGVINPVTGRRYVASWMAEELIPFALNTYENMGKYFGKQLVNELPVIRFFNNKDEKEILLQRLETPEIKPWVQEIFLNKEIEGIVSPQQGGWISKGWTAKAGHIVESMRNHLLGLNSFLVDEVKYEDIKTEGNSIIWKGVLAQHLIFCEGHKAIENPFFPEIKLVLAKGDLLTILAPELALENILVKGISIVPLGENWFRVGSTYHWGWETEDPVEEDIQEILLKLKEIISVPFTILNHQTGIRPTVKDRRPILGRSNQHKNIFIFNGMGTKGSSLAPYMAKKLIRHILQGEELITETEIGRFRNL